MLNRVSLQLRVGVDVGSGCHTVAIGLSDGSLLEEFEIPHTAEGFGEFFTRSAGNLWFVDFLTCRKGFRKLARIRRDSLLKVAGIGAAYANTIAAWQGRAYFAPDADLVGEMIQQDAARILELKQQIKALEVQMAQVAENSAIADRLASIPGFGAICAAELAGEIGTLERFRSQASLALYLGMATLDNSSGRSRRSKPPRHVNTRAKGAMMIAVDQHRKLVPQSQRYFEKKRAEGKRHNQAIRALGRHLCRVIFKLLAQDRPYRIDPLPQEPTNIT